SQSKPVRARNRAATMLPSDNQVPTAGFPAKRSFLTGFARMAKVDGVRWRCDTETVGYNTRRSVDGPTANEVTYAVPNARPRRSGGGRRRRGRRQGRHGQGEKGPSGRRRLRGRVEGQCRSQGRLQEHALEGKLF